MRDRATRDKVRDAYSAAASDPAATHPFPVGRAFALSVGYPDGLPEASLDGFAGVSNVACFAEIAAGATVLDVGCGAGLDTLIAARRAGRVAGIDFSPPMLLRAAAVRPPNAVFALAAAECMPLPDASVDVALANGIFNLNPARAEIFAELARVLKPGGRFFGAELILTAPLPEEMLRSDANWFA
ncbi:MAG TPA: methyltransferase type 11 [Solibacterales bacterium]|nr:methyltransferase type 11 [Bryobacterales bacterium]